MDIDSQLNASICVNGGDKSGAVSVESFEPTDVLVNTLFLIAFYFTEIYLQRVLPPNLIVHCDPETEHEVSYMVELLCAEKVIFKATKCLADAWALESQLCAKFYMLQSDKATLLMHKADLDIGIMTLVAIKHGLYRHPFPGAILHSKKYHHYC